ncbi:MAG: cellulase family glycosylhydrolase [Planctomycetota bacterium]|nr:cellulase family glycosylhydrolase [Planctomycetota bacterium]
MRRAIRVPLLGLLALICTFPTFAADWIVPDFPDGKELDFKPVPLYWFEVKETPYVYRTVVDVQEKPGSAVVEARSSGYLYVFVDGTPVFSYAPKEKVKHDPNRPFPIDLTEHLTPGRHALCVSAPRAGFALDGVLKHAAGTAPLASGADWRVMKFAPTTIIEDEAWLQPDAKDEGALVKAQEPFKAQTDLANVAADGCAVRIARDYDDLCWRAGLLARKGIVIHENSAYGWAGPERWSIKEQDEARQLAVRLAGLAPDVDKVRGGAAGLPADKTAALAAEVDRARSAVALLAMRRFLLDEQKALDLARQIIPREAMKASPPIALPSAREIGEAENTMPLVGYVTEFPKLRKALADAWGHPLNNLNESRYDRLGWLPHPDLVDSQIGSWGLRVNPILAPTVVKADGNNWRFSLDPHNAGEAEKRETIGYNIENQWARTTVPASWTEAASYAAYTGAAWYRTRIHIPAEWRGQSVILRFRAHDADKVWLNDTLVGSADKPGLRGYTIAADVIRPGAENVLAFKITGAGAERGLTGSVTLSCPTVETQKTGVPTCRVLATPLSPAVVLTLDGTVLEIQGWAARRQPGPKDILLPGGKRLAANQDYQQARDGKLSANWALLWLQAKDAQAPDRPVLLVFEKCPVAIAGDGALVRLTFAGASARVVAVRPWVKTVPDPASPAVADAIALWSRAALAVPVNYMGLTRMVRPGPKAGFQFSIRNVPEGPVLEHTIVYDYLTIADEWGTEPLKVAPLPSLASYAVDCKFRSLKLEKPPETLQDGGLLAPYRAVRNADRVTYSYPVEPFPRLVGFTSWMFAGSDTGVAGNKREVELIKATGSNCYRPQHNFGQDKSPLDPARTRVAVMADCCNRAGLNYMNNIDQTLGEKQEAVRTDYANFMEKVNKHYEGIARQLCDRPFFDVAYDLINEPFDHKHDAYNAAMKVLTSRVRAIDPVHLCYIEPCEAWGAIEQLKLIEPTGDPLTVYSFHDYNFRLFRPSERWPTEERDISNICRQWTEAFKFAVRYGVGMHCGEFGGFENATDGQAAQALLMNDFFRIFDQFGMHFNYYSGRSVYGRRADGSMALSYVLKAYCEYNKRGEFNLYYR